jgi:hypothetical protein
MSIQCYVYYGKQLKMNLPTSSVSISGLNCLELQALLLCPLVLAPRYGCFLQSRLQTESGRAAEYRRLASTCSKTQRPSKKQHKLPNLNDKNAIKPQISMLTQESCSWWDLQHHQPQPNDLLLQPAQWLAPTHTSIQDSHRSQRTHAPSDWPEQNKQIWTEHWHCKLHAVGNDLRQQAESKQNITESSKNESKMNQTFHCYSCFNSLQCTEVNSALFLIYRTKKLTTYTGVIRKSLQDFQPLRYSSRDGRAEGEHINR